MTKRFVGTDQFGQVLHGKPNLNLVALMMGEEGLVPPERVDYEIAKHVAAGVAEPVARAFIEGISEGGLTEDEAIRRIAAKDMPTVSQIDVVDARDLPQSKSFFGAWKMNAGKVVVDMPKARVIKTEQIRPERDRRIKQAGIDYQNADIAGDTPSKVKLGQLIVALKDLPATVQPDLDAITTPEALEVFKPPWPE